MQIAQRSIDAPNQVGGVFQRDNDLLPVQEIFRVRVLPGVFRLHRECPFCIAVERANRDPAEDRRNPPQSYCCVFPRSSISRVIAAPKEPRRCDRHGLFRDGTSLGACDKAGSLSKLK